MIIALKSPLVNVLLFSIFWALEIFITKLAFNSGAQVIPFTLQSIFITLIILSFYILPKKIKELKKIPFRIFKWLLIANTIHMGFGAFFSNAGIQLTTAINAGFILQFGTVTTIILAWLMLKEKMTLSKIITVSTIMLGTFFLITKGQLIIPRMGDTLLLFACIAWSFEGVLIKKILKNTSVSTDIVSFLRPVVGIPIIILFVILSPLYPPSLQKLFQVNIFEFNQIFYVALNGLFVSFVWIYSIRTFKFASASYMVMMSSITPILVAFLALLFLDEQIEKVQFIGILLIISSSFVTHRLKINKH